MSNQSHFFLPRETKSEKDLVEMYDNLKVSHKVKQSSGPNLSSEPRGTDPVRSSPLSGTLELPYLPSWKIRVITTLTGLSIANIYFPAEKNHLSNAYLIGVVSLSQILGEKNLEKTTETKNQWTTQVEDNTRFVVSL